MGTDSFFDFSLPALWGMWDLRSPTQDQACAPRFGSGES